MSILVDVAEAVVAHLNEPPLGFTAQRTYLPAFKLEELEELHVTVAPISQTISQATRDSQYFDCVVHVAVQQKVAPQVLAQMDVLVALVETVIDRLRGQRLPALPDAVPAAISHEVAFSDEHLDKFRVFSSLVSATYRVRR